MRPITEGELQYIVLERSRNTSYMKIAQKLNRSDEGVRKAYLRHRRTMKRHGLRRRIANLLRRQ